VTLLQAIPADGNLSIAQSVILGIVEGITEFLPVSSTAHLVLVSHAMRLA